MVAELLAERMEAKGLTQYQLAKLSKVPQGHLSKILSGEYRLPTKPTRDKLGGVLDLFEEDWFRAAGILAPAENGAAVANGAPIQFRLFDDGDVVSEAEMIEYVVNRPGRLYQERVALQRRRLSPERFRRWAIRVFNAFRSNSNLAVGDLEDETGSL